MKKPEEVYSLRKKAKQYFQRSLGIFILIPSSHFWLPSLQHATLQRGIWSPASSRLQKMLMPTSIKSNARLSPFLPQFLPLLYSLTDPHQEIQTVSSMFEAANNLSTYVPDFVDISVVSSQGTANSYYSGYSYSVLEELRSHQIFDTNNSSRGFIFLNDTPESSEYFIYYFPIQDFVANPRWNLRKQQQRFFCLEKIRCGIISMPAHLIMHTISWNLMVTWCAHKRIIPRLHMVFPQQPS